MREGFKKTPIGEIPNDWELGFLGEYLDYVQPTKYITNNISDEGNIPVLTANKAFVLGYTNEEEDIFSNLPVIIFDDFTTDCKFVNFPFKVRSSALKILVPKSNNIDITYLYESLKSINYQCVEHKRYWISEYQHLKIPLPLLPEQQKIAEILSTVDAKIEVIDQQITETQELKKGLMQRLLTKGIGHTEFKKSPLGNIPKSWEFVKLSEICDEIFLGLTSKVDYVESGGFPFVRTTDIKYGKLSFENIKHISEQQHKKLTKNRITKKGDVLVSKSGTLGTCAIVDVDFEFSTYESIITIQPKSELLSNKFLLQILQDTDVQKRMIGARVGGIVGHLNLMTFRKLIIPLPSLNEQLHISELLSLVDQKLVVLSKKKSYYQKLKKGLMQQLLTGKVRVQLNTKVSA
tara:strand:+ start:9503 stop:10717 length:1215 start_codon:yes stop_codon:yes gene_type:complete